MTSSSSLPTNRAQNLDAAGTEETKLPSNARSFKAKSLQPPSRKPRETFLGPAGGADHARSASIIAVQTAAKCPPAETAAPGSASKRISVMPPHATGLGARTISPTDARRMKRLSMAPTAPPLPSAATQAQTEPVPVRPRSTAQSPSYIPVKSATPSSNRTTPDPNRKSYSSGQSVSSNTSYNSVRSSGSSLQPRLPANVSTSRLPTPKPRVENLTNSTEEEVPPVPAIPKVYESPKSELDPPIFYTPRKSSLPIDMELLRLKRNSDAEADTGPGDGGGERASQSSEAEIDLRTPQASARKNTAVTANTGISKKNLQPLKLPPLNLLPLSTPMTTKIEALKDRKSDELKSWTPQNQIIPKTPSTPMTASKANFWAAEDDEDPTFLTQARSSTAHFAVSTSMALRTASSSSALSTFELPSKSRAISPYTSYTLPKSTSEYNHLRQKPSGDYSHKGLQPSHFSGARPQTQSSALSFTTETFSQQSTPSDPEANSISGASLRQVTTNPVRHGSIAKGQTTSEADPVSAKNETMPPPKLPASATWNSLSSFKSANPAGKPAYFHSRRQSSLSSVPTTVARKPSFSSEASLALESTASHESGGSDGAQRATSTILSPMQKILSSARASASAKARPIDPKIDPDEYVADEEMKRLASKRKEFEVAARNLDELRRRAGPKERVSPAQALKMASLNIFERGEIIDFKDIYFCGTQTAKKHVGDLHSSSANFGYDDERGDYNIVIGDHLAYRYEVVDLLGKGSFGQVVRCIDHKTGVLVAVKIIRNKKRFHQQALVEVNILQKLKEWVRLRRRSAVLAGTASLTSTQDPHGRHSVVNFTQSFYFRGHLCISTELLGINLYEFIKAHDFKGFALKLIRRFTKQMLGTLVLLHSKKVIHCDLKPENILLVHPLSSEIKVIDFGSSCFEHEKVYTYIQSRFYRSPEVILGMSYGMPIDMWSLGCILAELYTGYPIFPGENEQEQLACIMEIFGPPEKHLIEKSTRRKLFFDSLGKPRLTVSSKGRRRRPSSKDLRQVLKCDDEAFLDFIARCLRWDPARRLNPLDAMKHEFITGVKMTPRSRSYNLGVNSPAKRPNVTGTPSTRPLPEPPGTALKNGTFVRARDVSGNSPSKANVLSKRSTVSGMPPSTPAKRASNNTLSGTSLPRVATRSISGKPDLATAAAATSLVRPRPQAPASRTLI